MNKQWRVYAIDKNGDKAWYYDRLCEYEAIRLHAQILKEVATGDFASAHIEFREIGPWQPATA